MFTRFVRRFKREFNVFARLLMMKQLDIVSLKIDHSSFARPDRAALKFEPRSIEKPNRPEKRAQIDIHAYARCRRMGIPTTQLAR